MKDLINIWKLEDEAKELSRKIKKFLKHNKERGRAGRKGFHDQIENSIRIWKSQRKEILKKLKELKKNECFVYIMTLSERSKQNSNKEVYYA